MIEDKKILEMADNAETIDWENATQTEMAGYAMVTLKVSETSGKWALATIQFRMMIWYSLLATAVLLIGYKCDVAPLALGFINCLAAATFAGYYQLKTLVLATKVQTAVSEHDVYLKKLTKKNTGVSK